MSRWLAIRTDARVGLVVVGRAWTRGGARRAVERDAQAYASTRRREPWLKWYVTPVGGGAGRRDG